MAKDDKDILKIRAEHLSKEDADPAKDLIETPPVVSPARPEVVPPDNDLLNRHAPYEKQFAGRIERLKRPRKPGAPLGKQGWVFLVLALGALLPVLLWALNQQQKSRDAERFALKREQRALRRQVDGGVRPPEQMKEHLAALQAQLTLQRGIDDAITNQDYDEAIRLLSLYLKDNKVADAYTARGLAFYHKKEYDRAITDYSEAIRLNPNDALTFNNLAWVLATCPNDKVRDGKRAVEYATRACDLSNWNHFNNLDTLAAAYAECGDFKKAVRWQTKALTFGIEDKEILEQAQQRLKLYEGGNPYRE